MTDYPIPTELVQMADEFVRFVGHRDSDRAKTMLGFADRLYAIAGDLKQPSAGTSAYQMVAATAQAQVETIETLIELVVATVLAGLIDEEGGGRSNFVITPAAMDEVYRRYDVSSKRIGLGTEVVLTKRETPGDSLLLPPMEMHAEQGMDGFEPAEPQAAPHKFDRPLWAARIGGVLFPASDHANADAKVRAAPDDEAAQVENRFCYHEDCPAERCNRTEVASEVVDSGTNES